MTRRIKGQATVWLTGTSSWDVEKLNTTDKPGDFFYTKTDNDMSDMGWMKVGTAEIDVLLTTDRASIVNNQVATLKRQAQKIRAEAEVKASEIENEIKNLLAITYEPGEAA
jgi:hypothetical protein